ncbi:MAG: hypothetical protein QOI01_3037 [Mycobacterium sp.]|jgi:cytochrome P450|nr:hypothetical protein [Mycobacterium sp.]
MSAEPQVILAPDRQQPLEAVFRRLREQAPVTPVVLDGGLKAWLVTRHAEGLQVLGDPRFVKDLRRLTDPDHGLAGRRYPEDVYAVEGRHVLNSDGADHRRLRGAINSRLSARSVARLRPTIQRIAGELANGLAGTAAPDIVTGYAGPMTERVMGHVLGLPEPAILEAARLNRRLGRRDDPLSAPMREAYTDLVDLVKEATADRRAFAPETVIGGLWQAIDTRSISRRELVSAVMMLIGAGITSTAIAIGQGAAKLASSAAALRAMLGDDEGASAVVGELLRQYPPFPFSPWRFALETVEVSGIKIPAGAVVFVLIAAANRDPEVMTDPESLVPGREAARQTLTFGHGPHYCLGSHLAHCEIEVALRTLFGRFPDLRLAIPYQDLRWAGLMFDRNMISLPVVTAPGQDGVR